MIEHRVWRYPSSKGNLFSNVDEEHEAEQVNNFIFSLFLFIAHNLGCSMRNPLNLVNQISSLHQLMRYGMIEFFRSLKVVIGRHYHNHQHTEIEVGGFLKVEHNQGWNQSSNPEHSVSDLDIKLLVLPCICCEYRDVKNNLSHGTEYGSHKHLNALHKHGCLKREHCETNEQ